MSGALALAWSSELLSGCWCANQLGGSLGRRKARDRPRTGDPSPEGRPPNGAEKQHSSLTTPIQGHTLTRVQAGVWPARVRSLAGSILDDLWPTQSILSPYRKRGYSTVTVTAPFLSVAE